MVGPRPRPAPRAGTASPRTPTRPGTQNSSGRYNSWQNHSRVRHRTELRATDSGPTELPEYGVGFFLSTLGFHSHAVWAERLVPLGLDNHQANMLLRVAGS